MKAAIRDLVDGWGVGVTRMMSDAEGEIAKCKAIGIADEAKDHAELAGGRRQIDLETGGKFRAIPPFGIATTQSRDRDAFALELSPSLAQRIRPRTTAAHRVLGESALAEEDTGMPPPDGQGLPLAVCRLERPVLGL